MLFCFCNGEVITVIKKKLKDTFNLSHPSSSSVAGGDQMRRRSANYNTSIQHNNNNNNTNGSHTIRSVISASASNGDLVQHQQVPSATMALSGRRSNGTNGSNNSQSSSLLTTVTTASPIHSAVNSTPKAHNSIAIQQQQPNSPGKKKIETPSSTVVLMSQVKNQPIGQHRIEPEEAASLLQNRHSGVNTSTVTTSFFVA